MVYYLGSWTVNSPPQASVQTPGSQQVALLWKLGTFRRWSLIGESGFLGAGLGDLPPNCLPVSSVSSLLLLHDLHV